MDPALEVVAAWREAVDGERQDRRDVAKIASGARNSRNHGDHRASRLPARQTAVTAANPTSRPVRIQVP
ncbi:hypothetical protein Afe04nite_07780 [Asanoa ferruginea]|nr:hypothetical protein Afe04nite_07780 [Asanoa ferruginea]